MLAFADAARPNINAKISLSAQSSVRFPRCYQLNIIKKIMVLNETFVLDCAMPMIFDWKDYYGKTEGAL